MRPTCCANKNNFDMKRFHTVILTLFFAVAAAAQDNAAADIKVGIHNKGRVFEGIGALSAGASTRLLADYPEEQQSAILDMLFKPKYGASLQHLKIEIGGDVNSTSGTEPSHARSREELYNPQRAFYCRGYEWWLMKEAKKRNDAIFLDCLQWGSPGWIGDGKFYSYDNISYMIAFMKGTKRYHGLDMDYVGIWNERMHDVEFVKDLRRELDKCGLADVKIVASDQCCGNQWKAADDMASDKDFADAVDVIGDHYIEKEFRYHSTANAIGTGKPLWNSEGGPWKGTWDGFKELAKLYNRDYIVGKITKTITWSLITSYYENLALPNSGLMKANTPWSGYFEVEPALWAVAHTTQFTEPGWVYLDDGCGFAADSTVSFVTMLSPDDKDITIIVEAMDLEIPVTLSFDLSEIGDIEKMSQWVSVLNKESFIRRSDIVLKNGVFTVSIQPGSLYTFSTTKGQRKGDPRIPCKQAFPFPYYENFDKYCAGATPEYLSDQGGAFEVSEFNGGNNKVLRQMITRSAIEWEGAVINQTVTGDVDWTDYSASVKVFFPEPYSYANVSGRLTEVYRSHKEPDAYTLRLFSSGKWELRTAEKILDSGYEKLDNSRWHDLKIVMYKDNISAYINGKCVASMKDTSYSSGMVGLGSSFHKICFDDLRVE